MWDLISFASLRCSVFVLSVFELYRNGSVYCVFFYLWLFAHNTMHAVYYARAQNFRNKWKAAVFPVSGKKPCLHERSCGLDRALWGVCKAALWLLPCVSVSSRLSPSPVGSASCITAAHCGVAFWPVAESPFIGSTVDGIGTVSSLVLLRVLLPWWNRTLVHTCTRVLGVHLLTRVRTRL